MIRCGLAHKWMMVIFIRAEDKANSQRLSGLRVVAGAKCDDH